MIVIVTGHIMSFFAILFALLVEQIRPLPMGNAAYMAARSWARSASKTLDAGKTPHGWLAWSALVLLPAAAALAVHWLLVWTLGWPGVVLAFAMHAVVLYLTLGFRQFSHHFTTIREALDAGDEDAARKALAEWKQVDASDLPKSEIIRHVIEHSVLAAHRHVFGVLGWYALLAAFGFGPAGAIIYRLSEFAQRYYTRRSVHVGSLHVSPSLVAAAQQAWLVVDWLPARVTAVGFAIVGNFEEAIDSWRNFAQRLARTGLADGMNDNDGVILAATSGALGRRGAQRGVLTDGPTSFSGRCYSAIRRSPHRRRGRHYRWPRTQRGPSAQHCRAGMAQCGAVDVAAGFAVVGAFAGLIRSRCIQLGK
jgi:adenosylcobinamide-phosphate synthase